MHSTDPRIPLWQQLQATAAALQLILAGSSANTALAQVPAAIRPGAQALLFHVLRTLGRAQALRALLVKRAPPAATDALLCTALALVWQEQDAPYEVFTLVNQAVEAAKRTTATRKQASFINACLRRFVRERDALVALTAHDPVARWNHPKWWIDRLQRDWPQAWQAILAANNRHPPLTLRVNLRRSSVADYVQSLRQAGIEAWASGASAVTLREPMAVSAVPGFAQGWVSVQDSAAQLAAPLLLSGLTTNAMTTVLDACAAPGGKTAQLLEMTDCQVTALDIDGQRCERIQETLQRLGLQAKVLLADAAVLPSWWDGQAFDAILLDAPCSASGIVRRHPDVRWLRRASDITDLAATQQRLLRTLWTVLKPGGRLLYSSCSVFKAEGDDCLQTFLAHNTDAALLPSPGHLLPTTSANQGLLPDNQAGDHDGFYYALLEKRTH